MWLVAVKYGLYSASEHSTYFPSCARAPIHHVNLADGGMGIAKSKQEQILANTKNRDRPLPPLVTRNLCDRDEPSPIENSQDGWGTSLQGTALIGSD